MAEWKAICSERSGECCYYLKHRSGLPIYVWPKKDYTTAYAVFATNYGAIDTACLKDGTGEPLTLPAGTAHYLEHKLFENEDCDAFERYARTGASANAYTSFDQTAYLFTCTQNLTESLEILLDFVQKPYFTEKTVEKERGIIGQEIRMGEDSPFRRVFCNMLTGLYKEHPVHTDIAGTVDSIAEITPELLYSCYDTFYNLHNMVLAVSGNVTCEQVEDVADRLLKPCEPQIPRRAPVDEPRQAVTPRTEVAMPVAVPLFYVGYKAPLDTSVGLLAETPEAIAAAEVLEELLGGRSSALYASLMKQELINASFDVEYFNGPGYGVWIIGGESRDPDAVAAAFRDEVARLRREGVSAADFAAARNAVYGQMIGGLDNPESCGDLLIAAHMDGFGVFDLLDAVASLSIETVERRLMTDFEEAASSLSIVSPL